MVFGKKSSEETAFANKEPSMALSISPLVAVIFVSLACGSMVGAYFLGFRAGHTNGLELALANNVSQVVRSPVARIAAENINDTNDSSDVYAKLKEPVAAREESHSKPAEVSREVKEFLEPTATPSSKAGATPKAAVASATESLQVAALQEKKQADTAAIERALNDAKRKEEPVANTKPELDEKAVRVIGGPAAVDREVETAHVAVVDKESDSHVKEVVEDFSEPPASTKQVKDAGSKNTDKTDKAAIATKAKTPETKNANAKLTEKPDSKSKDLKTKEQGAKTTGTPEATSLPSGWYSQVAAPRSIGEAQSIASRLRAAGFKSRIETAEVRDQKYFRVVVGPEANRPTADQVLNRLKNQKIVKTEPFIRMVR